MDNSLQLTHERVDDVPLLLGFLIKLGLPQILDRHLPAHPLHQGLSNGWLIAVWITYILSQADHRKCHVRDWATGLHHTLESVTGQSFRPVDFTDDRLTLVLQRLSDPTVWGLLEADLWQSTCDVYELPVERIRLDSTTSYGYHTVTEGGLMQLGHSKDHRPDLPQLKLMAAAAEPTGMLVASDVHPGDAADDPLYLPLIRRVRELLGRTGLLYTGDCKMAALETRGEIDAHGDFYLTPLPMTGETQKQFEAWVDAAINGPKREELVNIRMGDDLVGRGYEFERIQTILCGSTEHAWTERVLIVRSEPIAQSRPWRWSVGWPRPKSPSAA
ncbi:MAG: IS1634 family transposase [Isosphaeraceae bacterium]